MSWGGHSAGGGGGSAAPDAEGAAGSEAGPAGCAAEASVLSHVMSQQLPCRMAQCPAGQFVGGQSMRHICIGESGHMAVSVSAGAGTHGVGCGVGRVWIGCHGVGRGVAAPACPECAVASPSPAQQL